MIRSFVTLLQHLLSDVDGEILGVVNTLDKVEIFRDEIIKLSI
jgi:hypothetical protein